MFCNSVAIPTKARTTLVVEGWSNSGVVSAIV
jgi:hypothetical protein